MLGQFLVGQPPALGSRSPWSASPSSPAAGYQHLTSRQENIIAAAILRHLHAVITTRQAWDPATASHCTQRQAAALAA